MSNDALVFSADDLALVAKGAGPLKTLQPTPRLAIFGDPVAHSASPPMHNAAARARGLDLQFIRILVRPEELSGAMHNLVPAGFLGASLTMPHKQKAMKMVDYLDDRAEIMGAINTVSIRDGNIHGHNTDAPGLSSAIREEFGIPLKDLRVLILGGAGGAGRAITVQCAVEGCPSITIANRNPAKGESLASEIRESLGKEVASVPLDLENLRPAVSCIDLIINATPLGMKLDDPSPLQNLPEGLLNSHHLVYDTVYSGGETALLRQARLAGTRSANGFSMLLHQGVLQNALWFGKPAPLESMRAALKKLTSR
jgi:shikimate dehydrogenase